MKRCEVCGRPIKTGYKYCYEHRHTRAENYGLPPDRMRRQYYAQPVIALILFGIAMIIASLIMIFASTPLNIKGYGVLLLIMGIFFFYMGAKSSGNIEKNVIRDKLKAKRNREELYGEVREEVYHKSHKPNFATRASDSLGNSLTNIFRGMQRR